MTDTTAYKILTGEQMARFKTKGRFAGAPIDLADGYIHLSTPAQLGETLVKHFAGQGDLWLVAVNLTALGDAVKWERSRGGQLFPHVYAPLTLDTALAWGEVHYEPDGSLRLPVLGQRELVPVEEIAAPAPLPQEVPELQPAPRRRTSHRRSLAILALCFGTALVVLDGAIATVALPTIARDLHVDGSAAVSVVTVYQLVLVMLLLPFSGLGDRIGLKRLYQWGLAAFTLATILCFFAKSLPFLLIVRAIQAAGAAAVLSVSSALIRATYPPKHLGRGLGINSVVVSSSAALAPTLGGLVLAVAPWPWVFASAVPFALASLALGRALPNVPRRRSEPFDVLGAVLCAATFGLVIGGLESAVHGDSPVVSAAIVAIGAFVAVIFVRRERREAKPILPVDLLGRPVLALSTIGAFTAFVATMTLLLSLPFRLQHDYGFSPSEVGAVIAPWPLTTLFVAPLAGTLSDRYPAGILGGIGMALAMSGLIALAFLPVDPGWFDIAWRMSLTGAGFGMFLSPNARLIIGSAPQARAAAAGGLISTTRMVGQTTGATLVAALLALGVAGNVPPMVSAGLALVAGLCSIARLRPSIRNPKSTETEEALPAQVR